MDGARSVHLEEKNSQTQNVRIELSIQRFSKCRPFRMWHRVSWGKKTAAFTFYLENGVKKLSCHLYTKLQCVVAYRTVILMCFSRKNFKKMNYLKELDVDVKVIFKLILNV